MQTAAMVLVVEYTLTMVSCCQGSPLGAEEPPPQINDHFSVVDDTRAGAQLLARRKVLLKRLTNGRKCVRTVSLGFHHGVNSLSFAFKALSAFLFALLMLGKFLPPWSVRLATDIAEFRQHDVHVVSPTCPSTCFISSLR